MTRENEAQFIDEKPSVMARHLRFVCEKISDEAYNLAQKCCKFFWTKHATIIAKHITDQKKGEYTEASNIKTMSNRINSTLKIRYNKKRHTILIAKFTSVQKMSPDEMVLI